MTSAADLEHRKMVREMLATDDCGFSDRQIEILDSLNNQDYSFTESLRTPPPLVGEDE